MPALVRLVVAQMRRRVNFIAVMQHVADLSALRRQIVFDNYYERIIARFDIRC